MSYQGGKGGAGVYQKIINQIPPHAVYISAFAGHDAVLLNKRSAASSIVIDSDAEVISYWSALSLAGVLAVCGDASSYLLDYPWKGGEFVYADPPYLMATRSSKRDMYAHEFSTEDEHNQLLDVLLSLPCMVALSGYSSSLYSSRLGGWRCISYNAVTRSGRVARESLWMNYPEPVALHDYSFLGDNFREREKITRQRKRWRARLLRMSALQRYALLSSIAELGDGPDRGID